MKIAYTINADGKTCTITGINLWGLKDDVFNIPPEINGYKVTGIGDYAFKDCSGLTSIIIPSSVTSIGHRAFFYCTGFTSVTIPDGVTSIGKEAFFGCLESITIPAGAFRNRGDNVFFGCDALKSMAVYRQMRRSSN